MTSEATLIFPHQLFDVHPALNRKRPVWLIEDSLFFGDPHYPLRFHKHKLVLHRASMHSYVRRLQQRQYDVTMITYEPSSTIEQVLDQRLPADIERVWLADPVDYLLERRLKRWATRRGVVLHILDTPMFLTSPDWFQPWFDGRKRYFMADFYSAQRKRMGILVDPEGKPEGGKWSFDASNRQRWPARKVPPQYFIPMRDTDTVEAARSIDAAFPDHPGSTDSFWYATTHEQALQQFEDFLQHRLIGFGNFEDAITEQHTVLHHAVLTPALNIGLITPAYVVERTLAFAREHRVPLNDLEGFLRQIIGWREFMRIVYVREGVRERNGNFWNHQRRLSDAWYKGTTGLTPLDRVIRRVEDQSYCHHIERLMILGNAMLLSELHPNEIYRWFMEMFIDAYDWVMVPNVYGMSQYADGGLITTKPYCSGSNYLNKMSNFGKGPWCEQWDGLYWHFINKHRSFFEKQPRLAMMVRTLDKMDPARRVHLHAQAKAFLR